MGKARYGSSKREKEVKGKAKWTIDDIDEDSREDQGEGIVRKRLRMSLFESWQPTADAEISVLKHTFFLAYPISTSPLKSHAPLSSSNPARIILTPFSPV